MRRKDREVTDFNKMMEFVAKCEIIHLGLADGDYPYVVPLNFGYEVKDQQLYLYVHGAMSGRKYELMKKNQKCSFEMSIPLKLDFIEDTKDVTMRYQSVMGKASIELLENEEKLIACDQFMMGSREATKDFDYNRKSLDHTMVAKLTVIEWSAKENPIVTG